MTTTRPLLFVHLGDLHITRDKEQNYIDFLSIVAQIETECRPRPDFLVLPGDNADNGLPAQYGLVATALKMLSIPVHVIPGDHDMEPGHLTAFYTLPMAGPLPKSRVEQGVRCLFLDISGGGTGGPDFRLGDAPYQWLASELAESDANGEPVVIFMHSYPDDLTDKQETAALNKLIARHAVVLVDIGHTHYNELANDGHTIFSATRSTGQIDEGPVGYSLITVDAGTVSWRFKPLHDPFPLVLITTPADYRLLREDDQKTPAGLTEVRALVLGSRSAERVACQLNQGEWWPMTLSDDGQTWSAVVNVPPAAYVSLTVEAFDSSGRPGQHSVQLTRPDHQPVVRIKNGSDADSIGAWPQNGIFGTQLGPNRNGKPS